MNMVMIWGIVAAFFLIIEVIIPALISIWFAMAAFVVMFLSFIIYSINIQILIFVCLSLTLVLTSKKILDKVIKKSRVEVSGELVLVTKVLGKNKYEVKYKGVVWSAYSEYEFKINDEALIKSFEGNKIILERVG